MQAASTAFPGTYPGVDDSWNFQTFKEVVVLVSANLARIFELILSPTKDWSWNLTLWESMQLSRTLCAAL